MSEDKQIVLFESADGIVSLPVQIDTVSGNAWLNRGQMALLYDRDVKTIGKHINNALKEELCGSKDTVVAKIATTAADGKTYQVEHYSIDVVLSVGYRVKSQRGIEFRRWATESGVRIFTCRICGRTIWDTRPGKRNPSPRFAGEGLL